MVILSLKGTSDFQVVIHFTVGISIHEKAGFVKFMPFLLYLDELCCHLLDELNLVNSYAVVAAARNCSSWISRIACGI